MDQVRHSFNGRCATSFLQICFLAAVLSLLPSIAKAQGTAAIKKVLLDAGGFVVDGICGGSSGQSELKFAEADGKLTVEIFNAYNNNRCTRDVSVTDTGFNFDGCRDTGVVMIYDAGNAELPFTGKGARCVYKVKRK